MASKGNAYQDLNTGDNMVEFHVDNYEILHSVANEWA
jgi:hypothetical protein